jgi:hypothetical protein
MTRTSTAFYVAYFESLIISVCGFVLLSGLLQSSGDYSSLQQWAVDGQFIFFSVTLVLQLLLSGIVKEKDVKGVDDAEGMADLLAPVANAYCSLCFLIFLFCMLMFAQSYVASDSVQSWVTAPNGIWYFHPANISSSNCTLGTWSDVVFDGNDTNKTMCLNTTRVLYRGVHEFSDNITNGTLYFQSEKSDAVQIVFGSSYASSGSLDGITTPSITGSISFAVVWAFVAVTLFVSCYAAYSSTAVGKYCPLFLSSRSVLSSLSCLVLKAPLKFYFIKTL